VLDRSVSFPCLLRQVSRPLSRTRWNRARSDPDETKFATANFVAEELHGLSYVSAGNAELQRIGGQNEEYVEPALYQYLIHELVDNVPHDVKVEQECMREGSLTLRVCRG
jgi:hypothetical protein